jgi:hypothetical protein
VTSKGSGLFDGGVEVYEGWRLVEKADSWTSNNRFLTLAPRTNTAVAEQYFESNRPSIKRWYPILRVNLRITTENRCFQAVL